MMAPTPVAPPGPTISSTPIAPSTTAGSPPNRKQTRLLARRLRQAGADGVRIQRPHHNVVATIPGRERGTVVVGAHHDTYDLEGLVGANDGASGVAVVLE